MADLLPPTPRGVPQDHAFWNQWYEGLRTLINNPVGTITWSGIDFTGSNITDIATRLHNTLQGLQGGTASEYYHLTSAQQAWVVAGNTAHGGGWQAGKNRAILDEGVSLTSNFSSINFVGAGVTATTSGDDVTVTVPGGGSSTFVSTTVTIPYGSTNYAVTITDALVTGASKIIVTDGMYAMTDENSPADIYYNVESVAAGSFVLRVFSIREAIGGPFKFNYILG